MTFEPLNRNRTIWNCLRLRSGNISGNTIFKFAVPAGLRARRNCFSREESLRTIAFAKSGLIRCVTAADATTRYDPFCENVFGASRGCATMKAPVGLSSGRAVCVSRWRGLNPDKLRRTCNGDDRRLWRKQGGAVGAAASRMQGPLKGRGRRWEPQPVQTPI